MIKISIIPIEGNKYNSTNDCVDYFKNATKEGLRYFYLVNESEENSSFVFSDNLLEEKEANLLSKMFFSKSTLFKNNELDIIVNKYVIIDL